MFWYHSVQDRTGLYNEVTKDLAFYIKCFQSSLLPPKCHFGTFNLVENTFPSLFCCTSNEVYYFTRLCTINCSLQLYRIVNNFKLPELLDESFFFSLACFVVFYLISFNICFYKDYHGFFSGRILDHTRNMKNTMKPTLLCRWQFCTVSLHYSQQFQRNKMYTAYHVDENIIKDHRFYGDITFQYLLVNVVLHL